jgi:dTDP-4-amino-4,6-dideoxygalactose transaminase
MPTVNMLDLKAELELFRDDVRAVVDRVLEHGRYIGGPEVERLEEAIAGLCGQKFAVAVSSGTDALLSSLMAVGVGAGDEVITTPFTFFATAGVIDRLGAKPVFVDIEPDTFNIDPGRIEAAITGQTKAIIPVHLFGQCADLDAITDVAARRGNIPVVEDAAQAVGAAYHDRPAGSLGLAATLSFYPTKNLGGFGEGGMILTGDEAFAERCRLMRNHGQSRGYYHDFVGGNFRLDSMKAGILLVKLRHLAQFQANRQRNAAIYDELLADTPVQTPAVRPYNKHVYHQYSILCDRRDDLMAHLRESGIGCGVYYPVPLHLQPCFADLGHKTGDFPESERAAERILSLPIHPMLTEADLELCAAAIRELFAQAG